MKSPEHDQNSNDHRIWRDKSLTLRTTGEERARWAEQARKAGQSLSEWIRGRLSDSPPAPESAETRELVRLRELVGYAVQFNDYLHRLILASDAEPLAKAFILLELEWSRGQLVEAERAAFPERPAT